MIGMQRWKAISSGRRKRYTLYCMSKIYIPAQKSNKLVHTSLIRELIRGESKKHNIVVSVYYRPPGQGKEVDDFFFLKQLADIA